MDIQNMLDELMQLPQELLANAIINIDPNEMNEFKGIVQELFAIGKKYDNSFDELIGAIDMEAGIKEYCIQSKCLHRGFYCPSPIFDLIVGGTKRGKLIKKVTSKTRDYYKYVFNSKNELLFVNQYISEPLVVSPYDTEIIIRVNDIEYGITFNNGSKAISYLSKAAYENGIIKSYSAGCYSSYIPMEMMSLHHEEYFYDNDVLTRALAYFNISPQQNIYDRNEFIFRYDETGKMYEYDALREFRGEPTKETYAIK